MKLLPGKFRAKVARTIKNSSIGKSVYYLFITTRFKDESIAVFRGIKMYQSSSSSGNISTLRRNIHRIEKGLITPNPRPYFAESYIHETVVQFKKIASLGHDKSSAQWAFGILNQYFQTVQSTPKIKQAETLFLESAKDSEPANHRTFKAEERAPNTITHTDFLNLNIKRRSVRYYLQQQVPRELVEKAVAVALQAPSACNRQPFMFRIIDDPELLKTASRLPIGTESFADQIQMMVFVVGDLSYYFDVRDKHVIYIDGSLAAMNFILSLETLGLSSCMINWGDIPERNKALKDFLHLNVWERCVMAISVGYADPKGGIPSSIKKHPINVIKYNV
ncbi:nitroreductase family protein [Parapedobacter tibetensis]|uniref:nitroreductase family protein n=1 Tax=Parapedobacter tibetensis TaxID=2972951 RepID=UPI00214D47D6|nr:nitroreductase family protein [Parapedobacter tibetensis]